MLVFIAHTLYSESLYFVISKTFYFWNLPYEVTRDQQMIVLSNAYLICFYLFSW